MILQYVYERDGMFIKKKLITKKPKIKKERTSMINPNETHLIRDCIVVSCEPQPLSETSIIVATTIDGDVYEGYLKVNFKVGDRVNLRVGFSIVSDRFVIRKATKRRLRRKKIERLKLVK